MANGVSFAAAESGENPFTQFELRYKSMCGIAGLSLRSEHPQAGDVVGEMLNRIVHRGPDSSGYYATPTGQAHLGFRRLAIRDLDARANQPMISASGKTAIIFNGEVYNSEALTKKFLGDFPLRTTGDTEVLLESIERYGIGVVDEFNGMFGLAVVDIASSRMRLVRDRMGKKPIFLYEQDGVVAFGSELRTLKPFGLEVDPSLANLFLHFGYFPSPYTFYKHTTQVEPGEIVELQNGEVVSRCRFHDFTDHAWSSEEVELDQLDSLLHDAVQLRKLSDVPLGAFLSGGVDSALVATHLRDEASEPTPTFTVAFADQKHNESYAAAETAKELSLPHEVIEINEQDLPNLANEFLDCYEQPYADTSGLVTMLLCRAVKQHVTVALSGDGGDEFFGGYARYSWFRKALMAQRLPSPVRSFAAMGVKQLDRVRGGRIARWLNAKDPAELYTEILRNWNATDQRDLIAVDRFQVEPVDIVRDVFDRVDADPLSQAACYDASFYIPDDLQVKLDRAAMRVALEVRCPLLDFRFANQGIGLRTASKYRGGLKSTLKKCLGRHLPPHVLNRPKHGFNVPLAAWLGGPMREFVGETLSQQCVRESGWLDSETIGSVWESFLAGKSQHAHSVWLLFNLSHHLTPESADARFTALAQAVGRREAA